MKTFKLARDFSAYPGGRFKSDGSNSGEKFQSVLRRLINDGEPLTIDLDGAYSIPPSFLSQSFGVLYSEDREKFTSVIKKIILTDDSFAIARLKIVVPSWDGIDVH